MSNTADHLAADNAHPMVNARAIIAVARFLSYDVKFCFTEYASFAMFDCAAIARDLNTTIDIIVSNLNLGCDASRIARGTLTDFNEVAFRLESL